MLICLQLPPLPSDLDFYSKIATIVIALANLCWGVYVFFLKDRKENKEKVERHNVDLFKELIIKPTISHFFFFTDNLYKIAKELNVNNQGISEKQAIMSSFDDEFISVRRKFIDSLAAADGNLKQQVQERIDLLQGNIAKAVYDAGFNLGDNAKFDELITSEITYANNDVIKKLFSYKGVNG